MHDYMIGKLHGSRRAGGSKDASTETTGKQKIAQNMKRQVKYKLIIIGFYDTDCISFFTWSNIVQEGKTVVKIVTKGVNKVGTVYDYCSLELWWGRSDCDCGFHGNGNGQASTPLFIVTYRA